MKKKMLVLALVLVVLVLVPACKKKAPGQMSSEAMLAMVPEGPVMLMAFNFQQFAALDLFDKTVKKDWQRTTPRRPRTSRITRISCNQTGIDLQKDVYAVVAAMYGGLDSENPEAGRHRQHEIRPGQAAGRVQAEAGVHGRGNIPRPGPCIP